MGGSRVGNCVYRKSININKSCVNIIHLIRVRCNPQSIHNNFKSILIQLFYATQADFPCTHSCFEIIIIIIMNKLKKNKNNQKRDLISNAYFRRACRKNVFYFFDDIKKLFRTVVQ